MYKAHSTYIHGTNKFNKSRESQRIKNYLQTNIGSNETVRVHISRHKKGMGRLFNRKKKKHGD